jgi:hypothetical protein
MQSGLAERLARGTVARLIDGGVRWNGFAGRGLRVRETADRRRRGRGPAARQLRSGWISAAPIRRRSIRGTRTSPESPDCSTTCGLLGQAPRQVVLVGVQPAAMGWGTELSPEVASALPVVLAEVARQLDRWTSAGGAGVRFREPQERHRKQSSLENAYERNSSIKDHRFHVDFDRHRYPQPRGVGLRGFRDTGVDRQLRHPEPPSM